MKRYIDMLRNSENAQAGNLKNLKNPPPDSSLGFLGTVDGHFEKSEGDSALAELGAMIAVIAPAYGINDAEAREMKGLALADISNALTSFRLIAKEIGGSNAS